MSDALENLFVLHGCDRKVGTTMLAHSIAREIAERAPGSRVLFAAVNGNDDVHYSQGNTSSIDQIRMKAENHLLTSDDLAGCCCRDGELFVLGGVKGVCAHRNFSAEFAEELLKLASETFEVVIVDCGNELDSGLCVGSLRSGGTNVLVLTQNESTLCRYENSVRVYRALEVEFSCSIINRYSDKDPHDGGYVRNRLADAGRVIFTVKEEDSQTRLAEMEQKLLTEYRYPGFAEDMGDIAYEFLKISGLKQKKESGRRKLFGFV